MGRLLDLFKGLGSQLGSSGPLYDFLRQVAQDVSDVQVSVGCSAEAPQIDPQCGYGTTLPVDASPVTLVTFPLQINERARFECKIAINKTSTAQDGTQYNAIMLFSAERDANGDITIGPVSYPTDFEEGTASSGGSFNAAAVGGSVAIGFQSTGADLRGTIWATKWGVVQAQAGE